MKYLKRFDEGVDSFLGEQIMESDQAREVISKYYTIYDEVKGSYERAPVDFLVEADEFLEKMSAHDGFIAGNHYNDTNEIISDINNLYTIVPHVYICPFWFTRYEKDIESDDIYADTIYVPYIEDFTGKDGKPIKSVFKFLNADELGVTRQYRMVSKTGKDYIRIWWD